MHVCMCVYVHACVDTKMSCYIDRTRYTHSWTALTDNEIMVEATDS